MITTGYKQKPDFLCRFDHIDNALSKTWKHIFLPCSNKRWIKMCESVTILQITKVEGGAKKTYFDLNSMFITYVHFLKKCQWIEHKKKRWFTHKSLHLPPPSPTNIKLVSFFNKGQEKIKRFLIIKSIQEFHRILLFGFFSKTFEIRIKRGGWEYHGWGLQTPSFSIIRPLIPCQRHKNSALNLAGFLPLRKHRGEIAPPIDENWRERKIVGA